MGLNTLQVGINNISINGAVSNVLTESPVYGSTAVPQTLDVEMLGSRS